MTDMPNEPPKRSNLSRWGYLIFLGFILLAPTFDPDPEPYRWPLEIGVVAVSALAFVWAELGRRRERLIGAGILLFIAVAATPFGSSAISVLPIYAAALVASFGSKRHVWIRLGVISAISLLALFTSPVEWPFVLFLSFPAVFVWIIGMAVYEDASLINRADVLRAENARIEYLATVTERERISRDLHDVAGQSLTALIMRSQLVQRLTASDPARAQREAEAIEAEARRLLTRFRDTVSGWQQASLTEELEEARRALEASEIESTIDVDALALAPSIETVLALALRESVTNVVRHSRAEGCRVALTHDDGHVRLIIDDDGVGNHSPSGSGLRGMRERVVAAGGTLDVDDRVGTRIEVAIPVGAQA